MGLLEIKKEILLTFIDGSREEVFYDEIIDRFDLIQPNHGIAFSIPLKSYMEVGGSKHLSRVVKKDGDDMGYEAIFIIVDRGLSEEVIEAAKSAGATGGTIIHGRGSGTKKKEKLFNIEIEPEKDIVLILSKAMDTEGIIEAVEDRANIDRPGGGIIFVLDVSRTIGLYEE